MNLDFMLKLNQKINSMNLFANSTIGLLDESESISIMPMPGGAETVYFDGSRDKDYQVQVNTKSKRQDNCMNALTTIYQTLEQLEELPSSNGSYDFQSITTASLPSLVMMDEQGFFIYQLSISAKITIYQGVKMNA
ncbi:minor capsid protein [Virgibacillus halodenitrificans]|uniref:minor capsid protein n=1 Tax=Virgibacillus halodenitrificans TaxID=1482 RepID=UPI0003145C65|nr:minor capsid protein [Virgibacillus halodenitrificans]